MSNTTFSDCIIGGTLLGATLGALSPNSNLVAGGLFGASSGAFVGIGTMCYKKFIKDDSASPRSIKGNSGLGFSNLMGSSRSGSTGSKGGFGFSR